PPPRVPPRRAPAGGGGPRGGAGGGGEGGARPAGGRSRSAGKDPKNPPPLPAVMVADRAAEHREARLQRVQHRSLGDGPVDLQFHLAIDLRERPQVCREHHPDHDSVWTSTDSTAGRSRTIGAQVSPASGEAYTWPPVVPN